METFAKALGAALFTAAAFAAITAAQAASDEEAIAVQRATPPDRSGKKRIGIFYGAGHLADMEKRLAADFGLKRDREQWVEAWDLRKAEGEKKPGKKGVLEAVLEALAK